MGVYEKMDIAQLQKDLDKVTARVAELEAKVFSSNAVLAEGLPVPRNCKYCGLKVTWQGNDEDCHKNPNR